MFAPGGTDTGNVQLHTAADANAPNESVSGWPVKQSVTPIVTEFPSLFVTWYSLHEQDVDDGVGVGDGVTDVDGVGVTDVDGVSDEVGVGDGVLVTLIVGVTLGVGQGQELHTYVISINSFVVVGNVQLQTWMDVFLLILFVVNTFVSQSK